MATLSLTLRTSSAVQAAKNFNRISSLPTYLKIATVKDTKQESSAETILATADGNILVYTDSSLGVIGMIDINDPQNPKALGNIKMQGELNTVSVIGNTAFVAVNTSDSYKNPTGKVHAINLKSLKEINRCELGVNPTSLLAILTDNSSQ